MPEEYQNEFFDEFHTEKGKIKRIADKISKRQRKFYLHMPLENVVVAVIVVIMCMIVAFALGTERGKRLSKVSQPAKAETRKEIIPIEAGVSSPELNPEAIEPQKQVVEPQPTQVKEEKDSSQAKPYTIQLISYKKMSAAEKEKNKLLKNSVNAFIMPSGTWYQVCAGKYTSVSAAKEDLAMFKNAYDGCFVRKRK